MIKKGRNTNLALHHHQGVLLWAAGLGEELNVSQHLHPNPNLEAPL